MGRKKPGAVIAREAGDCSGSGEQLKAEPIDKPNQPAFRRYAESVNIC